MTGVRFVSSLFEGLFCTLLVILNMIVATSALSSEFDGYDDELERQMNVLREWKGFDCLPAPLSSFANIPQLTPYWQRATVALLGSCVSDNFSVEQVAKYVALLGGTVFAGEIVAPYAISELKSDGAKCVMKGLLAASDSPGDVKEYYDLKIDQGFALKDWSGFVSSGVPSLKDVNATQEAARALAEFGMSGTERIGDVVQAREGAEGIAGSTYEDAKRWYNEMWLSEWEIELLHFEEFTKECRFGNAEASLERARKLAQKECQSYGDKYRRAQHALTSKIYTYYRDLPTKGELHEDQLKIRAELPDLRRDIEPRKAELKEFVAKFDFFDGQGRPQQDDFFTKKKMDEFNMRLWTFEDRALGYAADYEDARNALETPNACYAIRTLRSKLSNRYLADLGEGCRAPLYRTGPSGEILAPETLEYDLVSVGRARSAEWWRQLDEIRALRGECKTDAASEAVIALRQKISANPVLQIVDGNCQEVPQTTILEVLNNNEVPDHCKPATVPMAIIGEHVDVAEKLLQGAKLWGEGPYEKVKPKEGDTPGIVIDSLPKPGSTVKRWTGVKLTIYDRFPEEEEADELVTVPSPLVGQIVGDALASLTAAGLVGVEGTPVPADKIEMITGQVLASSPGEGKQVEKGSTVTLTPIGERPLVRVPSVAGAESAEAARQILQAAGFVAGEGIPGDPLPEGEEPFAFYTSNPPAETELEMFSTVVPIYYDEAEMRSVPSVTNQTLAGATSTLAMDDGFFVVPEQNGLSKERPEGTKLGRVHYTEPAAETLAPRGTVVKLFFYPPLPEEIGNVRPIPDVTGETPDGARGILAGEEEEPFFVVGEVTEKDEAPDDMIPNTVYETIPEIGSPELRGTSVILHVYKAPEVSLAGTPESGDAMNPGGGDIGPWIGKWEFIPIAIDTGEVMPDEVFTVPFFEFDGRLCGEFGSPPIPFRVLSDRKLVADFDETIRMIAKGVLCGMSVPPDERVIPAEDLPEARQAIGSMDLTRDGDTCSLPVADDNGLQSYAARKLGVERLTFKCRRLAGD